MVLKRTVSMRPLFEHSKYIFELMGKKIITILHIKSCLSGPMNDYCGQNLSLLLMPKWSCELSINVRQLFATDNLADVIFRCIL